MKRIATLFLLLLVFLITTSSAAAKYTEKITFTVTVKKYIQPAAPDALPEPDEVLLHEDHSVEDSEEEHTDMDKEILDASEPATADDTPE